MALALALALGCGGGGGSTGSATPAGAPAITVQPADRVVTVGQIANFAVVANGAIPLTYQWSRNGVAIPGSANAPVYALVGASSTDSGASFSVTVSNAAGSLASAAAGLTVVSAGTPVVNVPAFVVAGTSGCIATVTAPGAVAYAWTVTGATVDPGTGTTSGTLTFTPQLGGEVNLSCQITDAAGTQTTATASIPIYPPDTLFLTEPSAAQAGQGDYTASVPLVPGATYVWTVSAGGTITSTSSSGNTITFAAGTSGAVDIEVVVSDPATGFSDTLEGVVAIVPVQIAPTITAPAFLDPGQSGTASVTAQSGYSYAWTVTGGTPASDLTSPSVTFTAGPGGKVTLSLQSTDPYGDPPFQSIAYTVIQGPPPTFQITAPAFVEAQTAGYIASVPLVAGDSYAWTVTGAAFTAGAGPNQILFTPGPRGFVNLGVVVTDPALGALPAASANCTIVSPGIPVITGPAYIQTGSQGTATVQPIPGNSFTWGNPSGGTPTSGSTGNTFTFTAGTSGAVSLSVTATDLAGGVSAPVPFSAVIVPAPLTPTVSVPAKVSAGQTGIQASVSNAQPNFQYVWGITGGTPAAATGSSITLTAGSPGNLTLTCTGTSPANVSSGAGTGAATIQPAPVQPVIQNVPAAVTEGATVIATVASQGTGIGFAWTATGGTPATGTGTSFSVTAGAPGTLTLTCVASNTAGGQSPALPASAQILPPPNTPTANVTPAAITPYLTQGRQYTATMPTQPDVVYNWTVNGGGLPSVSTTTNPTTFTPTSTLTPLTLSFFVQDPLTSAVASGTPLTFTVVPAPVIADFGASAKVILLGQTVNLTGSFTGGTGVVNPGGTPITSAVALPVSPQATTSYTLTVTNTAGDVATRTLQVAVPAAPVITGFAASPSVLGSGQSANLTPTFDAGPFGSARITNSGNNTSVPVTSGGSYSTGALTSGITYTLTVTPSSGPPSVTAQAHVLVGTLSTFSGVPAAMGNQNGGPGVGLFANPNDVTVDPAGNIYVADGLNNAIRMITPLGVVSTVAGGSGPGSADGPGLQATFCDPEALEDIFTSNGSGYSGHIYVADAGNSTIRDLAITLDAFGNVTQAQVTTLAGQPGQTGSTDSAAGPPLFNGPMGLALDGVGDIYVSDTGNDTIRMIDMTANPGVVTTVAGLAGVAQQVYGPFASARFDHPTRMTVTRSGFSVFLADGSGSPQVDTLDLVGDVASLVGLYDPVGGLAALGNGTGSGGLLFQSDPKGSVVMKGGGPGTIALTYGTGTPGGFDGFNATSAQFRDPQGLVIEAGTLYVADRGNHKIRTIIPTNAPGNTAVAQEQNTTVATVAGGATPAASSLPFNGPSGIVMDPNNPGRAYVANGLPYNVQYNVLQVSPAGNPTPIASGLLGAGLQQLRLPTGLTIGGTANASLCLANPGDSTIQSLTYANGSWPSTFTSLAGTSGLTGYVNGTGGAALFNTPTAVTFGNGVLYVADTGNNAIRVITQTLGVQVATLAGNSAGTAGYGDGTGGAALFNGPQGLAMDPSGNNLLVADTNNNVIRSITPQGVVTTLAGDPTRTGGSADGPALAGARFDHPTALAADPVSGNIYVADTYNQTIRMLTPDGVVTTIVGTPENGQNGSLPSGLPGTLAFPRGIAVDNSLTSQGDLLITLADVVLRVHFN
jgi:hypothetical protein